MENLGLGKVLLVEDDEKLAGLIAQFLSQHGFEVRVVHRGDEALAAFLDFKPRIVVLDLMLPGQSGLHVCREIRNVSDTPIVILTAKEDDLDHILGLESGADDYVIKPIKPPVLLARLRALQRRQPIDRRAQHQRRHHAQSLARQRQHNGEDQPQFQVRRT